MKGIYLKFIITNIIIFFAVSLWAQQPTEQDCLGAITVCQSVYYQSNSFSGTGNYPGEIPTSGSCPGNCMNSGEKNDVWYIFTVNTGGNLGFSISPNNMSNDYDWAVYSLNDYDCEDIYSHVAQMQVACNWSGTAGATGATQPNGSSCQGASGSPFCKFIPVFEGETYVLNISNYSSSQAGYTLDFSLSTADIYDDEPPYIIDIYSDDIVCGNTTLDFDFSERVLCNSVQATDFSLTGPGGPYTINDVYGETCLQGGEAENQFTMEFDPPIYETGTYAINILHQSFIVDACNNTAILNSYEFDIDLNSPTANAGEDKSIGYAGTAQLDGSVEGGLGPFLFEWQPEEKLEDNSVIDPITINLTETTNYTMIVEDESNNCRSTDDVTVNIVGGPMSVSISTNHNSVCANDPAELEAIPSGGSGDYNFTWTSDPPGINYTTEIITVTPNVTTTYFVEVTDGYTTLNNEITITVFPAPIADAGSEQEINMGTYTFLDGSVSSGQEPYSYNWSPPDYIDGAITIRDPKTTILNENQNYLLNVVDDNGCAGISSEVTVRVTGSALGADPKSEPSYICLGDTATLISRVAGGGGPPFTLEWRTEDGSWSETGDSVLVNPTEDTKYFLKINDGYTSKDSITLYLAVQPLPVIDLIPVGYPFSGDTIKVCVRDTVTLDAGNEANPPDMSYLWSNGWGFRNLTTKTNGNLFDFQTFNVAVTNNVTGCRNNSSISIMFDFAECSIGIGENNAPNQPIHVYPNPNDGIFQLQTTYKIDRLDIQVVDLHGRIVIQNQYRNIPHDGWTTNIDISRLSKGMYMLKYIADNISYTQKIIKE